MRFTASRAASTGTGGVLGLKAGGYWPHNLDRRGIINHQSTVFLFDPDTGR
jgi:alanine dehydrogenase